MKPAPPKKTAYKLETQKPTNAIRYKLADYLKLSQGYDKENWTL